MKIERIHGWRFSPREAIELQRRLAGMINATGDVLNPALVAGVDISKPDENGIAAAAIVVLGYPGLDIVEISLAKAAPQFPYVPGLLSFRESPLVLAAAEKLENTPDLFIVDGQGIAHPRRMGYASHLGLFWRTPTIGCAKSLLCGEYEEPGEEAGQYSFISHKGEVIGAALRTAAGVRPVFVSVGNNISMENAVKWVMRCGKGYRVPEPTRQAHLAAAGKIPGKHLPVTISS